MSAPILAIRSHWPEYLIEGGLLGAFMVVACTAATVMHHPGSRAARRIRSPLARRIIMGVMMGATAVALIYSPAGRRSGAHMNPATTLAFLVLGKVAPWDAVFYIIAQFAGGLAGVLTAASLLRGRAGHPDVKYAATVPGPGGAGAAWVAEFMIALILMMAVLSASNSPGWAPYTGLLAGFLVTAFIVTVAPVSGMSLNPARTIASALPARESRSLWVYFTAPPLGMLAATLLYAGVGPGAHAVLCAKLFHGRGPCIFRCEYGDEVRVPHPGPPSGITGGP